MASQQEWIPDLLRQKARQQMEEAFTIYTNPFPKTAEEIETTVFNSSNNSKEKYAATIQNVMKKVMTMSRQQQAQSQQQQQGMVSQQGMASQQGMVSQQGMASQQGMVSQQGMMMRPMQTTQSIGMQQQQQQQMPAPQMQAGMQQMRQFSNAPMPRGPPSDSPQGLSMQSPLSSAGIGYSPDNRIPHPSPGTQYYTHRPLMQRPPQLQQPQQPQLRMPDNPYPSAPHGSVGSTYIPSLSPAHPNNSPQVSAMSPALRTPGSVSVAHSPASAAVPSPLTTQNQSNVAQNEEQMYMEKLKQLQKYIDPLSRMINKEKNSKDLSKMKSLRDVLMDPNKRLAMPTLLKCEKVLQNWLEKTTKPQPQTPPPSRSDQHMCQPILDAVASDIKSPMINHTLKRTFGPALHALNGGYYVPESSCSKRIRLREPSEDEDSGPGIRVPNVVQGEVARLGSKFKVTVDQSQSSNCGTLHLICRLDDASLPSVPPIRLLVPNAYPKEGPEWQSWDSDGSSSDTEDYQVGTDKKKSSNEHQTTKFLARLKPNMEMHINHAMDHNETISSILTAWERSVKETFSTQVKVVG